MTTALAQPEDAIWPYGFGVPIDMRHGVLGTASTSIGAMYPHDSHGGKSLLDDYEEAAADLLTTQNTWSAFAHMWHSTSQGQELRDTIYQLFEDNLQLFVQDLAMTTTPITHASKAFPGKSDFVISRNLQYDALRFVSWPDGWDGENSERIDCDVAFRALEIVSRLKPEFDEPFMAPAPSGAILLQWKFSDGNVVDVYVERADSFPECAVLTTDESVDDIELSNLSGLRSLLRDLESASVPH